MTSQHIWTLEEGALNYEEHRQLPITTVEAFTKSEESCELVLHVEKDADERYFCETNEQRTNLCNVIEAILTAHSREYKWFVVPDAKLRKFTTQKSDVDKENFKRPDDDKLVQDHNFQADFTYLAIEGALTEPVNSNGEKLTSQQVEKTEVADKSVDEEETIAK